MPVIEIGMTQFSDVVDVFQVMDGLDLVFRQRIPAGIMGEPCHL